MRIILAVAAIGVLEMAGGCNSDKPRTGIPDQPASIAQPAPVVVEPHLVPPPPPKRFPGYEEIDAPRLVRWYERNEISSDEDFKGRKLAVEGYVESVGRDIIGQPYAILGPDPRLRFFGTGDPTFRRVQCFFKDAREAALLYESEKVVIGGVCSGLMMNVLVRDCEILGH